MLTLRKKILSGYGIAVGLTILVLAWGLGSLLYLGQASEAILRQNYRSILAAGQMLDSLQEQHNAVLSRASGAEEPDVHRRTTLQQQFLLSLARAKENITIRGEQQVLEDIEGQYTAYLAGVHELQRMLPGDGPGAIAFYRKELAPRVEGIRQSIERLWQMNQQTMMESSNRAATIARAAVLSMVTVGLLALVAGAGFSLLLSARIVRPLQELIEATEKVAGGDYEANIVPQTDDELARLAEKFNLMVAKLRAFRDLNIRRIMEEKRKSDAILRSIGDGVFVVDTGRKVTNVNPAAAQALGLSDNFAEQKPLAEVIHDRALLGHIEESLTRGRPPVVKRGENFLTVDHGETPSHYEYSAMPVRTPEGNTLGVVVLLRNVTELKELDRLKSEFVMTASHELRTPLTSIGMSLHLLSEQMAERLSETQQELLRIAIEELRRLKAIVNDLLDLSKMESGRIELCFAPASVRAILEAAVSPFRSQAAEQGIELSVTASEDLPVLKMDVNKMTWAITNLIGNALRYTDYGGRIWVSAEAAGRWVHVYVRDDGAGIAYEQQARIFDKFVQGGGPRDSGGTGLGLAIAKEIIRAHRGHIWVESEPGKGSLFTIALPAGEPGEREERGEGEKGSGRQA